ncbi:MAG: class I SAM-dependent methyltransferase [Candidatus Promineifilaceae bacterium]
MNQQNTGSWLPEPANARAYTAEFDRFYTRFSRAYDILVRLFPIWRSWLQAALPLIKGPRVLEVGFGTGYLMTQYADHCEAYGVDINSALIKVARANLARTGMIASLEQASVEKLPYPAGCFDTVLSTMAFSGFPRGEQALAEMTRVLKPEGRLIILDIALPRDGNLAGTVIARAFEAGGDILRDMSILLERFGYDYEVTAVGGFGAVQRAAGTKGPGD